MSYQPAGACIVSGLINKKSVQESRIYAFATHLPVNIAKIYPFVKQKVTENNCRLDLTKGKSIALNHKFWYDSNRI